MDGAIPGVVVLGSLRTQAKPAMASRPAGSTSQWSLHQLLFPGSCFCELLASLLSMINYYLELWVKQILSSPSCFLSWCFITPILTVRHFYPIFLINKTWCLVELWEWLVFKAERSLVYLFLLIPCIQKTDKCDFRKEGLLVRGYNIVLSQHPSWKIPGVAFSSHFFQRVNREVMWKRN